MKGNVERNESSLSVCDEHPSASGLVRVPELGQREGRALVGSLERRIVDMLDAKLDGEAACPFGIVDHCCLRISHLGYRSGICKDDSPQAKMPPMGSPSSWIACRISPR